MLKAGRIDYGKKKIRKRYTERYKCSINAKKVFDDVKALGLERLIIVKEELFEVLKVSSDKGANSNNLRRIDGLYNLVEHIISGVSYEDILSVYPTERRLHDHLRTILTRGKYIK